MSWETVCAPLIHGEEGCAEAVPGRPGYFRTYMDVTGTPTKGWGSTGPDIRLGDAPWTQAQCDSRFAAQMESFASEVDTLVKVTINDNQKAALVSFVYNVGEGNLKGSTLLRLLNKMDYAGAAAQFSLWDHSKGKVLPGLVARRAAEAKLFMTPVPLGEPKAAPIPAPAPIPQPVQINPLVAFIQWLIGLFRRK